MIYSTFPKLGSREMVRMLEQVLGLWRSHRSLIVIRDRATCGTCGSGCHARNVSTTRRLFVQTSVIPDGVSFRQQRQKSSNQTHRVSCSPSQDSMRPSPTRAGSVVNTSTLAGAHSGPMTMRKQLPTSARVAVGRLAESIFAIFGGFANVYQRHNQMIPA